MGKGNEWRPQRRRGFDDDNFGMDRRPAAAPRGGPPRPPYGGGGAPRSDDRPSGPAQSATVKWFNAEKGFGFVELSDGTGDAFLHSSALERAGHGAVSPGTTLSVRVGQGQKGPQVAEVLEVDASTATPETRRERPAGPRPSYTQDRPVGEATTMTGTVKWYDPNKGFGFVAVEGMGKDVFVHASVLQQSGVTHLAEGQSVRMQVVQGRKGPEAQSIATA